MTLSPNFATKTNAFRKHLNLEKLTSICQEKLTLKTFKNRLEQRPCKELTIFLRLLEAYLAARANKALLSAVQETLATEMFNLPSSYLVRTTTKDLVYVVAQSLQIQPVVLVKRKGCAGHHLKCRMNSLLFEIKNKS